MAVIRGKVRLLDHSTDFRGIIWVDLGISGIIRLMRNKDTAGLLRKNLIGWVKNRAEGLQIKVPTAWWI